MDSPKAIETSLGLPDRIVNRFARDVPLAFLDLLIAVVAYLGPLVLRFEGAVPDRYWRNFWVFLPVAVLLHLLANYLFGLYGQMWRYASVQEARRLLLSGSLAGGLVIAAGVLLGGEVRPLPLSTVILGAFLSVTGFGAIRFQNRLFGFRRRSAIGDARVLIVGAGDAGAMLLRDLIRHPLDLNPVGLIDDDPRKAGRALLGRKVLGTRTAIPSLVRELEIDQVLFAIPSATSDLVRNVAALCEEAQVTLRILPSVREIVGTRVTARDIRELNIEDLLGRQQVQIDMEAVAEMIRGRRVLVTGAGGSIGTEIARQVSHFDPAALFLLDHDETHLHDVAGELEGAANVKQLLADIRSRDRLFAILTESRPEIVFHAAAHKHVPILESHPGEAVFTNLIGTANVADASVAAGVKRFVLISTDKAVKPASVMGASKWFAEQIVRNVSTNGNAFCSVRFGNVLGSRGSVIPTFFRQLSAGRPITVTDPGMKRYFMSVQEAVQLVLQAAALSRGGEVFTLDMGEPVNILDLANKLIRLSGRIPGKDVKVQFVGARPGEKLSEDVVDDDEHPVATEHPSIVVSHPPALSIPEMKTALWEFESMAREGRNKDLAMGMKLLARRTEMTRSASEAEAVAT